MKIGILCAGDKEFAPFLNMIDEREIIEKARLKFHVGKLHGVEVVGLFSGVCKVNAAIAAQILIDMFKVDAIINAGTAGGMDPKIQILDTVICTEAIYHDVAQGALTEFHPWMENAFFKADKRLIELSKAAVCRSKTPSKVYYGRMATGEAFITDVGRREINDRFNPLSVDMETAAIAHVCHVFEIPFIAVRSITDTAAHSGEDNFAKNCRAASVIAKDIVLALIDELKCAPLKRTD